MLCPSQTSESCTIWVEKAMEANRTEKNVLKSNCHYCGDLFSFVFQKKYFKNYNSSIIQMSLDSPVHLLSLQDIWAGICLPPPCPGLQAVQCQHKAAPHQARSPPAALHLQRLPHLELHMFDRQKLLALLLTHYPINQLLAVNFLARADHSMYLCM